MSTMQHFGKGVMRVAKNYTKGYSDVQAKVRDATSNDPWGPSGTQMNEIAQMTYNQYVHQSACADGRSPCGVPGMTSLRSWRCSTSG